MAWPQGFSASDEQADRTRDANISHGCGREGKWRLLLPGASGPRLTLLRRQGFKIGLSNRLRGLSNRSIVVVGNYSCGPITVEPYRAKARPLRPRRSYFAPVAGIRSQRSVMGDF